jgi:hypothetical protein
LDQIVKQHQSLIENVMHQPCATFYLLKKYPNL